MDRNEFILDRQRRVYAAEEEAQYTAHAEEVEIRFLEEEEVPGYLTATIASIPAFIGRPVPEVFFDEDQEGEWGGHVDEDLNIHLDPGLQSEWRLLYELAHALDGGGHNPTWTAIHLLLVTEPGNRTGWPG